MQLTKHTDFALRCLMYVATLKGERLATISEISEHFSIPKNHLMKVVNQLARLGYIETTRGPKGGISLGKRMEEIKLAALVRDFEARLDPVNCDEPICPIKGACELKRALQKAQNAFLNELEAYSLADLVQSPTAIVRLIDQN